MKYKHFVIGLFLLIPLFTGFISSSHQNINIEDKILFYIVDPKIQDLQFYWKDEYSNNLKTIQNLKTWLERKHKTLKFAMNGGIFMENFAPLGLFIQNFKLQSRLNTRTGYGNFYVKPNGVFYITSENNSKICKTEEFRNDGKVKYATQSGPMLVIDGTINPSFTIGSTALNIRNGVGILPNNKVIFAMSKETINFYDFAKYFKDMGCKYALYLDGCISQTYLPEKNWEQTDGEFGVIIGVTEP